MNRCFNFDNFYLLSMDLKGGLILFLGYRSGFGKIVKLLVDHGANVYAKERTKGLSPLHVAAGNGKIQIKSKNIQKCVHIVYQ